MIKDQQNKQKCHNCEALSPEIKKGVYQCPNENCMSRFTI